MASQAGHMSRLASSDQTLHHPRILCLHGGGSNGDIFRAQARVLIKNLPGFRLVFADAPFYCAPGPGIVPVYEGWGPFRRWLRWLPEHAEIDNELAAEEVLYNIHMCKRGDAGDGPWVGLIGFSQGAKLAASLLYDQQIRTEKEGKASTTSYKFAVLLAGRSPLVSFCEHSKHPALASPGVGGLGEHYSNPCSSPHVLSLPTIHVHGLNDAGLLLHRKMLEQYHDEKSVTLIEWDGTHRVPIKTKDVERVTKEIYRVAREEGVQLPGEESESTPTVMCKKYAMFMSCAVE